MPAPDSSPFGPAPPLPPQSAGSQNPPQPNMMTMMGMGQPGQMGPNQAMSPGMSQISETAVRMGSEIDQAMKMLAQAIPQLAPWVEKTVLELRYQIGSALNSGAMPTDPTPDDQQRFPDGGGRI